MAREYDSDGWYYGYAPMEVLEFDANGERIKMIDSRNVVGRFRDSRCDPRNGEVIDGEASRAARKAVYMCVPILEAKNLKTASAAQSAGSDIAVTRIRFDEDFLESSLGAVKRFKEAWEAYQLIRKAPISAEEADALGTIMPQPKAPRKPRKPKAAENVVQMPPRTETA